MARLSGVKAAQVEWLWEPYLPLDAVAMLSGEPGCGTTYLALAIAAAVTRGWTGELPGYTTEKSAQGEIVQKLTLAGKRAALQKPAPVLYWGNECAETILRPRLEALGGDVERFHVVKAVLPEKKAAAPASRGGKDAEEEEPLSLLERLETAIMETEADLVILDPIQVFNFKGQGSYWELRRIAKEYQCCILLVRHVTRTRSGRIGGRSLGATDLGSITQSELVAGISPYDAERRSLVHVKSNVGPLGAALEYTISRDGHFGWTGPSDEEAQELLGAPLTGECRSALEEAMQLLRAVLGEPQFVTKLQQQAREAGISWTTMWRAKQRLHVISRRTGSRGAWYWVLPQIVKEKKMSETQRETVTETMTDLFFKLEQAGFFQQHGNLDNVDNVEMLKARGVTREDLEELLELKRCMDDPQRGMGGLAELGKLQATMQRLAA